MYVYICLYIYRKVKNSCVECTIRWGRGSHTHARVQSNMVDVCQLGKRSFPRKRHFRASTVEKFVTHLFSKGLLSSARGFRGSFGIIYIYIYIHMYICIDVCREGKALRVFVSAVAAEAKSPTVWTQILARVLGGGNPRNSIIPLWFTVKSEFENMRARAHEIWFRGPAKASLLGLIPLKRSQRCAMAILYVHPRYKEYSYAI